MDISQGYITMPLEEFTEIIANYEKIAMKAAIKALMTDLNTGFNKYSIDLMLHHHNGVDTCNINRSDILAKEMIENTLQLKPEILN